MADHYAALCKQRNGLGGTTSFCTSVPWRVLGPEDDSVPVHDVVGVGGPIDALGRVIAQALEVPHEPLRTHQ